MPLEIKIVRVPERRFVGVRRRVKPPEIGPLCAEVLPRVGRWLADKGLQMDGMPITVYHSHDQKTGDFDLQPGAFVAEAVEGEGDITVGVTAVGHAAHAVHAGPYDMLGETWEALWEWIAAQGRTVSKPAWEMYVTDPGDHPDPKDWRTEIFIPLD